MKAMILAAGRGERMRPLTDFTPKPLLQAAGRAIIEHTLLRLVAAGFTELVINHAHLGAQIEAYLGNGQRFGADIRYSPEGVLGLETAGGIINALPLLGKEVFLLVNGDIATDFPFAKLHAQIVDLAHLVLVENPPHHRSGDFALESSGLLANQGNPLFTYSGIGLFHPELFEDLAAGARKLAPLLREAIDKRRIAGELYNGFWLDVGTPERLQDYEQYLLAQQQG